MKTFYTFAVLIFLFEGNIFAQPSLHWAKNYDDAIHGIDKSYVMATDASCNVYVAGQTDGSNGVDYLTRKYDAFGNLLWEQTFDGAAQGDDIPNAMKIDNNGNVYVTGKSQGTGTGFDYATVKYNSSGVLQAGFPVRFNNTNTGGNGNDVATDLVITSDGSKFYVTGYSNNYSSSTSGNDWLTIAYNSSGNFQWLADYNSGTNQDSAFKVLLNSAGEIYVLGSDFNGSYSKIKKYDATGSLIQTAFGSKTVSMKLDANNFEYIISSIINGGSTSDIFLDVNNTSGFSSCSDQYNGIGGGTDVPTDIVLDPSNNAYVSGYSDIDPQNNVDLAGLVVKFNTATCDTAWTKRFQGAFQNGDDRAITLVLDNNHNVIVTGYETNASGNKDIVILKLNGSTGAVMWQQTFDKGCNNDDIPSAIALDNSHNIFVTGYSNCSSTSEDFTTLKYCVDTTTIPVVSWNNTQLQSTVVSGNQWYFNGSLIVGATSQNYTPLSNGNYKTCINCFCSCSDSFIVSNVGINETPPSSFTLYPNPVSSNLTVSGLTAGAAIQITDISGRVIFTSTINHSTSNIDMSAYPEGVYILRSGGEVRKIVRL